MSNTLSRKNAKNVPCCVKATFYTSSMVFSISSLTGLLKRLKNVNALMRLDQYGLQHVQGVTTDGECDSTRGAGAH